jgi:hypothetical protein
MASRYSRKDGAQENNMIIDFEQYKREHAPEAMQSAQELEALEGLNSAFSNFLGTFSTNGMMMDIHTRVGERFSRLQLMEIISERASDAIAKAGFDPDRFRIDPPVFERFLSREIETVESVGDETWDIPPETYWNGPYYDARWANSTCYRWVSTSFCSWVSGVGNVCCAYKPDWRPQRGRTSILSQKAVAVWTAEGHFRFSFLTDVTSIINLRRALLVSAR